MLAVWCLSLLSLTLHAAAQTTAIVVNVHVPVTEVRLCRNWVRIDTAYSTKQASIATGDTLLIIQMKGASADANGMVLSMGKAGRFERNVVARRSLDTLFMVRTMLTEYDVQGSVQVVTMRQLPKPSDVVMYDSTQTYTITTPPFDGRAGGVVAVQQQDTVELWCDIRADGAGYGLDEGVCAQQNAANAGRAADGVSSGGGHGGRGGLASPAPAQPQPGIALSYTSGVNWIFMGGGPGAIPGSTKCSGGGIVILDAPGLHGNAYSITANGDHADLAGQGAAAGGAILITSKVITGLKEFSAAGGNSVNGGAGGGGVIRIGTITPFNLSGSSYAGGNALYGKTGGGEGGKLFYNVSINESTSLYKSEQGYASADTAICPSTQTVLFGYGGPVMAWTVLDDTLGVNTDSLVVSPTQTTTYAAHIMVNGCIDTVNVVVTVFTPSPIDLGLPIITCPNQPVTLTAPTGYRHYRWSTGDTTATIVVTEQGMYAVTALDVHNCSVSDSIEVRHRQVVRMNIDGLNEQGVGIVPSVQPFQVGVSRLTIRNTSDTVLHVSAIRFAHNTVISAPLHQFPIIIAPFDTASVTITAQSAMPGRYRDTASIVELCGTVEVPIQAAVEETPWYTRCKVRVTVSGEVEELLRRADQTIDVLGRQVQSPMSAGLYLLWIGSTPHVVQKP